MLRIGQFTDTFLPVADGVGRVVVAYAETLSSKGQQVTVSSPLYDTGFRGGYPYELVDYRGRDVFFSKQYKTGLTVFDRHYRERMKMIPLDLVHSHSPFIAGREALRIARQRGIPMVSTFHSKYYDDFLKVTHSKAFARLGTRAIVGFYNHCDEVWACGDSTAGVLAGYGYCGRIVVMPNGVTLREPEPAALAEAARQYHIDAEIPALLFVGQMNWKKNIMTILSACVLLREEGFPFRLILAGQGPDRDGILEKIHELGLDAQVTMAGHITDNALLDALYALSSLFVFPSLYDNAPMVIREAAVMKTPSVMVEGSSGSEVIRDGINGYLSKNDADSLAGVIRKALSSRVTLQQVGERAFETIPVPWDVLMDRVIERYTLLVEKSRRGELKRKPV